VPAGVAQAAEDYTRTAGGLTVYLGVMPAEIIKGQPTMHGGIPSGRHEHQIVVAIFDINSATLLHQGIAPDKIDALDNWPQSQLFSDKERIALEYAEADTLRSGAIDEDLFERLRKNFDEQHHRAHALIAFQNLSIGFAR
jgi:hypothetical protein